MLIVQDKYATLDLKNFYLYTELARLEYMRIPITLIPQKIIDHYNLLPLVNNGFIMTEIIKEFYSLPQAGILVKELLDERPL